MMFTLWILNIFVGKTKGGRRGTSRGSSKEVSRGSTGESADLHRPSSAHQASYILPLYIIILCQW